MTLNKPQDPEKIVQLLTERLAKVISLNTTADLDPSSCIDSYFELKKKRLFLNEFIPVSLSPLTLVGEAPKGLFCDESPVALLWFWNNHLCPMYTLTLWWRRYKRSKHFSLRFFLPAGSEEFQSFLNDETRILLLRNKKCLTLLSLNARALDDVF